MSFEGAVPWYGWQHRRSLPFGVAAHPVCAPLLSIQSFYRVINTLALCRGYNPDLPPHLKKVTETV